MHFALGLGVLFSGAVCASPAEYVYTPTVEFGEKEIDFKFGQADLGDRSEGAMMLGFGYGATENWFTELYLVSEREPGEHAKAVEWENKFQLTEPGKYPVDIGLLAEIEAPIDGRDTLEFKAGALFQSDWDKLQINLNVLFERKFNDGEHHDTELLYQLQAKYRYSQAFEFGVQGFGEVGKWNDWEDGDAQSCKLGPAIFGKLPLANHQAIKYNAAWLYGMTDATPDHTFRMQVEYEF